MSLCWVTCVEHGKQLNRRDQVSIRVFLFELLVLRCTALERVSGIFTAYEVDYRNNQTELLNGVRNFEAALQAVSIEALRQLRRGMLLFTMVTILLNQHDKDSDESLLRDTIQRIEQILSPPNCRATTSYEQALSIKIKERYPGTCQWIDGDTYFNGWRSSESKTYPNILWIHALPGSGKSVMAAYIVEHPIRHRIWTENSGTVLYFFCQHDNTNQATATEIVKSLMLQIFRSYCTNCPGEKIDRTILATLDDFKNEELQDLENPQMLTKFSGLIDAITKYGPVWTVIDGLDECENQEATALLEFVATFCDKENAQLKLLLISRREQFLKQCLDKDSEGT
jgi:KAP family P-loop domain